MEYVYFRLIIDVFLALVHMEYEFIEVSEPPTGV